MVQFVRFVWFFYYKTANHTVPCGAVWCTITYGTAQLCYFTDNFYSLCGLANTPRLNHLVCPYQVILFAKYVHVLLEDAVSVS